MGPYVEANLAPACTMCNMMKGCRTVRGLVECARHLATKHTPGEDFGLYPSRFRDNVSRRARSGYLAHSSRNHKTHAITNEQFNAIVAQKCHYCHKEPRKPKTLGPTDRGHFNGLDRLDSSTRIYTTQTVVACCGDCNMMKYRFPEDAFLDQCRNIARFNVGADFQEEDADAFGSEDEIDGVGEGTAGEQEVIEEDLQEDAQDSSDRCSGGGVASVTCNVGDDAAPGAVRE